jgi:6-phosphogluconate dehydrogenase
MQEADMGLIGLGVMGQNLVLNLHDHGYRVAVYNRTLARLDEFLAGPAAATGILGCRSLADLVTVLHRPRRVLLMVQAGAAVDQLLDALLPLVQPGDILIDGGNSLFTDTTRRTRALADRGILYIGSGISGGEDGARHGPAIMPGGNAAAWPALREMFQAIAAQVDGVPCCQWVGGEGAGHYVKMVHNGIEYGDMQLIAEAYWLLRRGLGMPVADIQRVFAGWCQGPLDSYLIAITADILARCDADGAPLLDRILDSAGQKGTGKWTSVNALELGVPLTLISEAVFARYLSALKDARVRAAARLPAAVAGFDGDREAYVEHIRDALYASKIVSYTQGYMLMREAAGSYSWDLRLGEIALIWRGGCIIRSRFLDNIHQAYERDPNLENLLLDEFFRDAMAAALPGWRRAVGLAVALGVPAPGFAAALSFYDGYRSAQLPANLVQAQRDYFGAHTYERVDRPRGEFFHSDWSLSRAVTSPEDGR